MFPAHSSAVAAKLWSLRLSSLARLRLTNQASAECTNLFAVLNAVPPTTVPGAFPTSGSLPPSVPLPSSPAPAASLPLSPSGLSGLTQLPGTPLKKPSTLPSPFAGGTAPRLGTNELLHPFELTVFHARVHYWSGDPLGYVDALSRILGKCKERAREEGRVVMQRREVVAQEGARGCNVGGTSQCQQAREDRDQEGDNEDEGKEGVEESTENAKIQDEDGDGDEDEGEEGEGENDGDEDDDEGKEDAEESTESVKVQDVQEERTDDVLAAAEANLSMWLERIARICLILASQMIEMNVGIVSLVPLSFGTPLAFLSFCSRFVGFGGS